MMCVVITITVGSLFHVCYPTFCIHGAPIIHTFCRHHTFNFTCPCAGFTKLWHQLHFLFHLFQRSFTATETVQTIRDRDPRMSSSTFTLLLSSNAPCLLSPSFIVISPVSTTSLSTIKSWLLLCGCTLDSANCDHRLSPLLTFPFLHQSSCMSFTASAYILSRPPSACILNLPNCDNYPLFKLVSPVSSTNSAAIVSLLYLPASWIHQTVTK